jgi:ABC-type phosphate transport system substrate-binding protein
MSTIALVATTSVTGLTRAATADTPEGTLYGEGSAAIDPIMLKLIHDDGAGLSPDYGSYTTVDVDNGIADFVGTAPGTFNADFAVSERPLTSAEAAQAAADGRTYAYVPFAADPVAIVTLVPSSSYTGGTTIDPSQFCQHVPLTLQELADLFGYDPTDPLENWDDPRITCSTSGGTAAAAGIARWANLDPTMENYALEAALDSSEATETTFQDGLTQAAGTKQLLAGATVGPSEDWPYAAPTIPGGDEPLLGKMIGINPKSNTPSDTVAQLQIGAAVPVSADWAGAPLGAAWNLPTAAVQNEQGAFVYPSAASAEAAEADATLSSTSDPTTDNLVTFIPSSTDSAAYNSYLMLQSYLVVPLNGLPADKAIALAQFIRFVLGGVGQTDIANLGAAPATAAMVAAGLNVAKELNEEAVTANAATSTSGTPTTTGAVSGSGSSATTTTVTTAATASKAGTGNSGSGTPTTSALAVTGSDPLPLLILGGTLGLFGEAARRVVRRRRRVRA